MTASIVVGGLVGNAGRGIRNRGGSFGALSKQKLGDEVAHHMPQNAFMKRSLGIKRDDGPALGMSITDHELTRTYFSQGNITNNFTDVGRSARQRLATDVRDIRNLFGSKYRDGLRETIQYAKTLDPFKK